MKLTPKERELRVRTPAPFMLSYTNSDASSVRRFQTPGFDVWVYKVTVLTTARLADDAVRSGRVDVPSNKQILAVPVLPARPVAVRIDGTPGGAYAGTVYLPSGWYVPAGTVLEVQPNTTVVLFGLRA